MEVLISVGSTGFWICISVSQFSAVSCSRRSLVSVAAVIKRATVSADARLTTLPPCRSRGCIGRTLRLWPWRRERTCEATTMKLMNGLFAARRLFNVGDEKQGASHIGIFPSHRVCRSSSDTVSHQGGLADVHGCFFVSVSQADQPGMQQIAGGRGVWPPEKTWPVWCSPSAGRISLVGNWRESGAGG
jgi:hypothetical protein